jgi:hypothetical protein
VSRQFVQGPGSLRVGRFIGRLGVVSLPAVQAGLDLDQRVVRRHVAKLEAAGWLARTPWVWGEVKRSKTPGAVIAESGGRREDRQKMILEGWRDAIWSGRYLGVRYDCASPSVARWINRLAKKVGLTDSDFTAAVQTTAEQIAALPPAAPDDEPAIDEARPSGEPARASGEDVQTAPAQASSPRESAELAPSEPSEPEPEPEPETAEAAAEREGVIREVLGMGEPKPRRRWRR